MARQRWPRRAHKRAESDARCILRRRPIICRGHFIAGYAAAMNRQKDEVASGGKSFLVIRFAGSFPPHDLAVDGKTGPGFGRGTNVDVALRKRNFDSRLFQRAEEREI